MQDSVNWKYCRNWQGGDINIGLSPFRLFFVDCKKNRTGAKKYEKKLSESFQKHLKKNEWGGGHSGHIDLKSETI